MWRSDEAGANADITDATVPPDIHRGDHVYQWCSVLGIPMAFSHHGIVMDISFDAATRKWSLLVADFDNWHGGPENNQNKRPLFHSSRSSSNKHGSSTLDDGAANFRVYRTDPDRWRRVEYGVTDWKQRLFSRAGTVARARADPPGVVLARVQFLLDRPDRLPAYDVVRSNCECVAVWCRTGTWETLQATHFLHGVAAGQAKSTAAAVAAAATTQVTVPAAGMWGWAGYTTQVGLLSVQPWLLPAIVAGGVVTVGAPALWLAWARKCWRQITEDLGAVFWESVEDRPDLIVELIVHFNPNLEYKVQEKSEPMNAGNL